MSIVGASQEIVERAAADKFASLEELALPKHDKARTVSVNGRINPQLSCTIAPDDKELLNELSLYACNREKKMLNTSIIVRALIRLGNKYRDELTF